MKPLGLHLFACVVLVPLALADSGQSNDAKDQRPELLNGEWVLEAVEQLGVERKGDQLPVRLRGMTRTIDGGRMIVTSGGREYEFSFAVDTTTTPHQIDMKVESAGRAPQRL